MAVYKFVWPTGYSAHMTVPQFESACKVAEQWGMTHTVTVEPMFGGDGCILIQVDDNMWIAVETDGYAHS